MRIDEIVKFPKKQVEQTEEKPVLPQVQRAAKKANKLPKRKLSGK